MQSSRKRTKKKPIEYTDVIVAYEEGGHWIPLTVQGNKEEVISCLKDHWINGKSRLPRHSLPVIAVEFSRNETWDAVTGDFRQQIKI